jgi:S-adenosylmethionine hydrolase
MLITLTTDFGYQDAFVGIMKGVIATINPKASIVDLTHGIPVQDVMAAALTLRHAIGYFPRGTIHVAVVDPGVGSNRKPLLIENDGNYLLGPDNGIFSLVVGTSIPSTIVELANPAYRLQPTSNTFHGRDIFAPAAAHLSLGISPEGFGPRRDSFLQLVRPKITRRDGEIDGEIIYIDGFGNLFTNVEERDLTGLPMARLAIALPSIEVRGLASTYAGVGAGGFVAVINSWGLLEVSVFKGNAQRLLSAKIGDRIRIRWDG